MRKFIALTILFILGVSGIIPRTTSQAAVSEPTLHESLPGISGRPSSSYDPLKLIHGISPQEVDIIMGGQILSLPKDMGRPFIDGNQRTHVPLRFIAEKLGCLVQWDAEASLVHLISPNNKQIWIPIGTKDIYVDNLAGKKENTTYSVILNGRTHLPLRIVMEALDYKVYWYSAKETWPKDPAAIQIVGKTHTVPDTAWEPATKVKLSEDTWPFSLEDPPNKLAYVTLNDLPLETSQYTLTGLNFSDNAIEVGLAPGTENCGSPDLYIVKDDYVWVRKSYRKNTPIYKQCIIAYGNDDNPLTREKLNEVDAFYFYYPGYVIGIKNPLKEASK